MNRSTRPGAVRACLSLALAAGVSALALAAGPAAVTAEGPRDGSAGPVLADGGTPGPVTTNEHTNSHDPNEWNSKE
ncbi:hypothetical protein [Streptomyces sp. NPDC060031]|uniref:hypothetical protein n=1 Tax=Streptomyces sp. NPDC060031 TaxID=3347043 RepID=UPI0036C93991